MNVTVDLKSFANDSINVEKEEAGTSAFNQSYDKFKVKQYKDQTSHLLELER